MAVERVVVADRTAFLRRPDHRVVRALALLGLVLLWELVARTGWVSPLFLPSPSGVLAEGLDMARSGQLLVHLPGEAVEGLRPVQRDQRHAVAHLVQDGGFAHERLLAGRI